MELVAISQRQAERMAAGRMEGRPEDYRFLVTEEGRRLREARSKLEDRALMKELGLGPEEAL